MRTLKSLCHDLKVSTSVDADISGFTINDANNNPLVSIAPMINSAANSISCVLVGRSFDAVSETDETKSMMICNIIIEEDIQDMKSDGGINDLVEAINVALFEVDFQIVDFGFTGCRVKRGKLGSYTTFDYYVGNDPFLTFLPYKFGKETLGDEPLLDINSTATIIKRHRSTEYAVFSRHITGQWDVINSHYLINSLLLLVQKNFISWYHGL